MVTEWDAWLRDLRAAGKGGARWPQLLIDRGRAWSKDLRFGVDWSEDAFSCNLAASPDGTTLVSPSVSVGAYVGGYTMVTLSLTAEQTANLTLIPADSDLDGVVDLPFCLLRNSAVLMAGVVPVSGKV
jgi:hypothetical protein